jgi:hypothetical protein
MLLALRQIRPKLKAARILSHRPEVQQGIVDVSLGANKKTPDVAGLRRCGMRKELSMDG